MKKLILLGALSVLLYSAPGHTGKRGKGHQEIYHGSSESEHKIAESGKQSSKKRATS